jgi:hypothetical protein
MREDVAARRYGMVLDHNLFVEYWKFKRSEGYNKPLVNKILSYYHNEFITNVGQFEHNNIQIDNRLKADLAKNGLTTQNLEELAALTTYKIILTDEKTHFPYVNIDEGRFNPVISTFYEGDSERDAAKDYLRNLCKGAKNCILLYDGYINVAHDLDGLLNYILPNTQIQFIFPFNKIDETHRNRLKETHSRLSLKDLGSVPSHHDRYLIIDDTIEVVLTSGFEYLQNQKKEISLVIRPIKSMHGLKA